MTPPTPRLLHRTCNLCESMCGITVAHDGSRIHAIRGDRADPFSEGHVCPKVVALADLHQDPDRLRQPIRRTSTGWETLGWDDALDLVAHQLDRVRRKHGRDSVGIYYGNPTGHNHGALIFLQGFMAALGSRNRFAATSVDHLPHLVAAKAMFGSAGLLPVPDLERTNLLVIMGGNPLVSQGSIMSSGNVRRRLERIRQRGRVVVIDPRRTETARVADQHLAVRPGTDALLLLGVLRVVVDEGLARFGHLAGHVDGFDHVARVARRFDLDRVAAVTGVGADEIRGVARTFARERRAVWYGRLGTSTQAFGSLCQWLINVINLATGHLDTPGGAMFTRPAVDLASFEAFVSGGKRKSPARRRLSRVRGLPSFLGEWPVSTLADEIMTPGEGQIRAMVTIAGNPVLTTPNGKRLDEAFGSLDFMVAIDPYRNETTRHAHVILPPTMPLERDHYDLLFHAVAIRNGARYSPALFERGADQRHDWEILRDLIPRLAPARATWLMQRSLSWVRPDHVLDLALRTGPYGAIASPFGPRLTLRKLKERTHGIDLGPHRPCLIERLRHADRKVKAAPKQLLEDVERLERELLAEQPGGDELLLFGRRDGRSKNSWLHNCPRLVKGKSRCTALLHPDDAKERGIADGDTIEVQSRIGSLEIPADVTRDVCPGTVCIPHGWGHGREGVQLRIARANPGVNVNDIVDDRLIDAVSGTSVLNGAPVRVRKKE